MATRKNTPLAKTARLIGKYTATFEGDEMVVTRGEQTVRLPLATTVREGEALGAAFETDRISVVLEALTSIGYGETADVLKEWPTLTVGAVIKGWISSIEEAQGIILGESLEG